MERIRKYLYNNTVLLGCGILAILFAVACFVPNVVFVGYGVAVLMIIVSSLEDGLTLLAFSIPFCCLNYPLGFAGFACAIFVFVGKAYIKILFFDKKNLDKKLLVILAIFALYCLLPIGNYDANKFIKLGAIFALVALINIFVHYPEKLKLKHNLNILSAALFISAVYTLFYFVSPYMEKTLTNFFSDMGKSRYGALFQNVNNLAMVCEISLGMMMYYVLTKKMKPCDYISVVILSILGISTMSKTFLILFVLMALIFVVAMFRYKPMPTIITVTIISCIVLIFTLVYKDFVIRYIDRFFTKDILEEDFSDKMNYFTTTRWGLWVDLLDYMGKNPLCILFGAGLGVDRISIDSPHNFYLSMLFNLGIVGSILMICLFVRLFKAFSKNSSNGVSRAVLVPFLVIGLLFIVEDFIFYIYSV